MSEDVSLNDQDIESALEAYRGLSAQRRAWEKADVILGALQGAKNYVTSAMQRATVATQQEEAAKRAATETTTRAAKDADLIVSSAEAKAKRVLDEAAVIAADNDRLRGETSDLQVTKTKLLADVQRLTKTVADLEAIR